MDCSNANELWQDAIIGKCGYTREMLSECIQKLIEVEFANFIAARKYQRTEARNGQRNGHYKRELNTRIGTLNLQVCRDRAGKFKTEIFDKYQRSEKALLLTIVQMYISGVSTRKVRRIVETLCGVEISKSQVSELIKKLDPILQKWRDRPLEKVYPYLVFDARYEDVRENGHIVSKAFVTIIGISNDGVREIIGCYVINSESFEGWSSCFENLKNRGLKGVAYGVADQNKGLETAFKKHFQGSELQRCQVHFMRNFLGKLAKNEWKEGITLLRDLFAAPSKKVALDRLEPLKVFLCKQKKERVFEWLEESIESTLVVYNLPEEHWNKMKTTNQVERLNEDLKKRSRVVRIFPNEQSCLRLLSAICLETSETWRGKKYLHFY